MLGLRCGLGAGCHQAGYAPSDADLITWLAALEDDSVPAPSSARQQLLETLITSLKASGDWAELDDLRLVGQDYRHGLYSLVTPTLIGSLVNMDPEDTADFEADRAYKFNGLTQALHTGFIPATHGSNLAVASAAIGIYERSAVAANTYHGVQSGGAVVMIMSPNSGAGNATAEMLSAAYSHAVSSSIGLTHWSRAGSDLSTYKNGALLGTSQPGGLDASLPTFAFHLGARNVVGILSLFRAAEVPAFYAASSVISAGNMFAAIEAYLDAIGAGAVA